MRTSLDHHVSLVAAGTPRKMPDLLRASMNLLSGQGARCVWLPHSPSFPRFP